MTWPRPTRVLQPRLPALAELRHALDDPADDEDYIDCTRQTIAGLAPWTGRGVYVNMLNFDEQDRVVEAMGGPEKEPRSARLKIRYDPANLFRMNVNIAPAGRRA